MSSITIEIKNLLVWSEDWWDNVMCTAVVNGKAIEIDELGRETHSGDYQMYRGEHRKMQPFEAL